MADQLERLEVSGREHEARISELVAELESCREARDAALADLEEKRTEL